MQAVYQRIEARRASHALVLALYQATRGWPAEERYGLTAQIRRAAISVPLNIAEGAARRGSRDYARFLGVALGSMAEVNYCLQLAHELGYPLEEGIEPVRRRASVRLWRLYSAIRRSATAQAS